MSTWDEFHRWLDDGQPGGVGEHLHQYVGDSKTCATCGNEKK